MKQKKLCLRGTVIPSFAPQNKRKTGMDFLYFAAGRYSVHSFSDRLIASEVIRLSFSELWQTKL